MTDDFVNYAWYFKKKSFFFQFLLFSLFLIGYFLLYLPWVRFIISQITCTI